MIANNYVAVLSLILTSSELFLTCTSILTRVTGTDFLSAALILSEESVSLQVLVCLHSLPIKVQVLQTALQAW